MGKGGVKRVVEQPANKSLRTCTTCGHTGPVAYDFYRCKFGSMNDRTYGCAMPCIECNRKRCRGKTRSPEQRARDTERAKRPEVIAQSREYHVKWYATPEGKAHVREYDAKKYAANGDAIRAANRERYRTNESTRESIRRSSQKRRQRPEVRAANNSANAKRKKTERGRLLSRMHAQLRRVRLRTTICTLTDQQWLGLVDAYGGRCAYCDETGPMTIDHILAVALGGEHSLTNVAPACRPCNLKKNAKPLQKALRVLGVSRIEFLKRRGLALFRMIRPIQETYA